MLRALLGSAALGLVALVMVGGDALTPPATPTITIRPKNMPNSRATSRNGRSRLAGRFGSGAPLRPGRSPRGGRATGSPAVNGCVMSVNYTKSGRPR